MVSCPDLLWFPRKANPSLAPPYTRTVTFPKFAGSEPQFLSFLNGWRWLVILSYNVWWNLETVRYSKHLYIKTRHKEVTSHLPSFFSSFLFFFFQIPNFSLWAWLRMPAICLNVQICSLSNDTSLCSSHLVGAFLFDEFPWRDHQPRLPLLILLYDIVSLSLNVCVADHSSGHTVISFPPQGSLRHTALPLCSPGLSSNQVRESVDESVQPVTIPGNLVQRELGIEIEAPVSSL